jgi:hypothetical protein
MSLDDNIEQWVDLIKEDRLEADKFYYKNIFPEISSRFIQNYHYKNYDYLISLLGFSERPVILSILATKPKNVLFLYTEETKNKIPFISDRTKLSSSQIERVKIGTSSEREIHEVIQRYAADKDKSRILIEITGGKKSMIGAAAQIALVLKIDAGYIDGEYIHDLRQPKPGTEYFRLLEPPSE